MRVESVIRNFISQSSTTCPICSARSTGWMGTKIAFAQALPGSQPPDQGSSACKCRRGHPVNSQRGEGLRGRRASAWSCRNVSDSSPLKTAALSGTADSVCSNCAGMVVNCLALATSIACLLISVEIVELFIIIFGNAARRKT